MTTSPSRRSNRVTLSFPVEISGVDAEGKHFSHHAVTTNINRHGCSIRVKGSLAINQRLQLQRDGASGISEGRVVCHVDSSANQSMYGVELLAPSESLWGIQFSSTFHEGLLDALQEGVYFVDTQRRITYWSRGAERLSGYSASETTGKRCFDDVLAHIDCSGKSLCRGSCMLSEAMADGQARESVMYLRHKDGHRVPISSHVVPMRDVAGRIIGAVEMFRQVVPAEKSEVGEGAVEQLAFRDLVTGLPNRAYMEFTLARAFKEQAEFKRDYGLLMIDVDHFKSVNDTYGHELGDVALKAVGDILVRSLRGKDLVSRWGGEEFVALLSEVNAIDLGDLAERCRSLVSQTEFDLGGHKVGLTVSIGGTLLQTFTSPRSALSSVDELMYCSKKAGRNCTTLG